MALDFHYKLLVTPATGRCSQGEFINITKRHSCFSGGYGNGKSFAASIKALILLTTFPKYRIAICRYSATDLKRSTMSTFFKVCPPELYDPAKGGNRADSMNSLRLINGSEVFWMHLDDADEKTVRGLEINSFIIDQGEEISENMYDHLKARLGRWDVAEVPPELLAANPDWPLNAETGRPMCPAYGMTLCNPDSELHWIYRRFHPESMEFLEKYAENYEMVQASSTENPTLDPETLKDMLSNDPVWVRRFVFGMWGIPGGAIHELGAGSILELDPNGIGQYDLERKSVLVNPAFLQQLLRTGIIYRVLDHGDASPTCCLWFISWKMYFFVFQEYYKPESLISDHRLAIHENSKFEDGSMMPIRTTWADPSIFRKNQQKFGGWWSTADEYSDRSLNEYPLHLIPADNNEIATRNRLNEYLRADINVMHPVTGTANASRFYFFKRNALLPNGCFHAISELRSQKRKQIGTLDGKPMFSDDRDEGIPDHAYDCERYFTAMHPYWSKTVRTVTPSGSFFDARKQVKMLKMRQQDSVSLGGY